LPLVPVFLLAGRAADARTIAGGALEGNQTNLRGVDLALAFPVRDSIVLITSHLGYVDWLAIVTRDEITLLWPQVETIARARARTDFDRGGGQGPPRARLTCRATSDAALKPPTLQV
jgi:hypothetical protein